jgi:hypothetical protein
MMQFASRERERDNMRRRNENFTNEKKISKEKNKKSGIMMMMKGKNT